jgi:hypothetical protein
MRKKDIKMTKEKLASLTKYASTLKDRLNSPVPEKHVGHPETFKAFLKTELKTVETKLENAKMAGVADKK